ncbi:MAG: hypothetical protein AB7V04_10400 [Desulfomonilaceae bacterium]
MKCKTSLMGLLILVWAISFVHFVHQESMARELSDAQISKEILKEHNKVIIETFLKNELTEVNQNVTNQLLQRHPSLVFFIKQVEKGPLNSLLFLEEQVHKLRDVQKNIDSLPYSIAFSAEEKRKILGLKTTADKIVSYGIPLIKRDFYRVLEAAKVVADKRRKHPVELMSDQSFRDSIYREVEPTARGLDEEMGKLSEGELICMRLGFVLEQVTVTNLWLMVNDNRLPKESDFMLFRKKRSEYFQKKLKRIYGNEENRNNARERRNSR